MLEILGSNFKEFLNSLDVVYEYFLFVFFGLRMFSFYVKDEFDGSGIEIFYYFERIGFEYMVVGMVKVVVNKVFNFNVNIKVLILINDKLIWSKFVIIVENFVDIGFFK